MNDTARDSGASFVDSCSRGRSSARSARCLPPVDGHDGLLARLAVLVEYSVRCDAAERRAADDDWFDALP
jgi:hypothetical protein